MRTPTSPRLIRCPFCDKGRYSHRAAVHPPVATSPQLIESYYMEIKEAALALPASLATFFYADDPVVPAIHRLWKALGRELPAVCFCAVCDPPDAQ